jgi:hypothetical protein
MKYAIITILVSFSFNAIAAKCLGPAEWKQVINDTRMTKISNGGHILMYDRMSCDADTCDLFIYSRMKQKDGDGTCYYLNKHQEGKYVWGSLRGNGVKIRMAGNVKDISLAMKKKK